MRKIVIRSVLALAFLGVLPATARAQMPANPECWGIVTSQLATNEVGSVGAHASKEATPRQGLHNVATAAGLGHVSDLGTFLASIDDSDATQCP